MPNTVNITIDGRNLVAAEGETILRAASAAGIRIPTLCHLNEYNEIGGCRLCIVEVKGGRGFQASCVYPVSEGMVVNTNTESLRNARKSVLELLLSNHNMDCLTCAKNGTCKLQDYCFEYDVKASPYSGKKTPSKIDDSNEFYVSDPSKCVMCRRCVSVCAKMQCTDAIGVAERGFNTHVAVPGEKALGDSRCVSCGNCVSVCPTGALTPKYKTKFRPWETKKTKTTCAYCGVGCELYLVTKGNVVVDVQPSNGSANRNILCVKGKFGFSFINHQDRLTSPLVRKNGVLEKASWEEAYETIVSRIKKTLDTHGADGIAGLSSARVSNEENYLFQKLMRAGIGTNNVDHCARLCHASTVSGLAATLGSGAMTNSIEEALGSDVIFITGSNTTENHPVIGARIKQAKLRGAKVIVAEPRRIELAELADVFLQIAPGTNVALLNGMMHVILAEGLENRDFIERRTEGFEALRDVVSRYAPETAAEICGIDPELIVKAARMYAKAERASIYYSMGVTQHSTGTQGVMSVSNLAVLCGQIGRESTGVNPLRGQNNVQGACDMGALPGDLPGYQKVGDRAVLEKFGAAWNATLSGKPGLTLTEMIHAAERGDVRFLYIMGENPMISDPDLNHVKTALDTLDFLVVQDIFLTETAALADVVLPAVTFAEKDGTFTNTERRVQRVRKAIAPVGQSKPDWVILMELLNRLGVGKTYEGPSDIMDEIASLTPIYGGITYQRIEHRGLQWPCLDAHHPGTKFLHAEKFSRGKALFKPSDYVKSAELPDSDYPFVLTTGRILYHYHTMSMTGRVEGLLRLRPSSYVEINPDDARMIGVSHGETVCVTSRRGDVTTRVSVTDIMEQGVVFMPFHFPDGPANRLTNNVVDPTAKIPEFKVCAVRIRKPE